MNYPEVLNEEKTLELALTHSLARFGDGELRIAIEAGNCTSQLGSPKLAKELRQVLSEPGDCIVGIPNVATTTKPDNWKDYEKPKYTNLYRPGHVYGSSFITRPDSAPGIDNDAYWEKVKDLWRGKDVILISGNVTGLQVEDLVGAKSIRTIDAPRVNAYTDIDRIEAEIGDHCGPVIMCLGTCATVLAWRLAKKGIHALDLGHIGHFMRHAGSYSFGEADLVSPEYAGVIRQYHTENKWGGDGHKRAKEIEEFVNEIGARNVVDYGCGRGTLAKALPKIKFLQYDPGIKERNVLPKPSDLVVCTDVLEHIEPEKLDNVLKHICCVAEKGVYLSICTRPANAILPDGRNAHLLVREMSWWLEKLEGFNWKIQKIRQDNKSTFTVWILK